MKPIKHNPIESDKITTGGDLYSIVSNFLKGVVSDQYEIKLIQRPYVITRNWTEAEILKNINFLSKKNRQNLNVYIRPLDKRFILLDDLTRDMLIELARIKPCLLMETSPGNYQAWIKFKEVPPARTELTNLWRTLAAKFQSDPASAKPDQIGRLPGFFNMKPKYSPNFPFVKLHKFENRFSKWTQDKKILIPPPVVTLQKAIKMKPEKDRSAFDFAVVCSCIEKGWQDEKIKDYLMQKSDKAKERGERYLNTTIANARRKVLNY